MKGTRRPERQGGALREAFADDGVHSVVNEVLLLPQKLHHRVVRLAEDTAWMLEDSSTQLWRHDKNKRKVKQKQSYKMCS